VTEGNSYQFKLRAKNIWGWSEFSSVLTVVAAHAPDTMATPTTSIDSATGGVTITWTAPASNGDDITSYTVEILNEATDTWSTETTDCDGSDSTIMGALSCTIPMSTFAAAPFTYTTLSLDIPVRLSATNDFGTSTASP
jgi:hypothetical protein